MGLGRRDKPPTGSLYPRESYVCFFIFLVELLCTWSLVALIYNNWIFYLPTAAEIEEGFEPDPVMCTTTRHVVSDNCTWWSCMEWCLSATAPPSECIHLYTNVRNNGSEIRLAGCNTVNLKQCDYMDLANPNGDWIFDCRTDFTCHHLEGTFLCTEPYQVGVDYFKQVDGGSCKNITKMYECATYEFGETLDCKDKEQCLYILGLFKCRDGKCREVLDYRCERRCKGITCDRSVILMNGDNIFLGDCETVSHVKNDALIWQSDSVHTLLADCHQIELDPDDYTNTTYIASDCINGTLMERSKIPRIVNYTRMLTIFASEDGYKNRIDKGDVEDIPFDTDLMIYKETKLKMNHEGCSNSLSEECTLFHDDHGKDGRNYTTRSRFPCYFTKKQNDFVASFLDLEVSHAYYVFMLVVPGSIFICSCFFCICCSFIVIVDKEGHMHLRGCYSFFRRPRTEYEKWLDQHEKRKKKRLAEQEELRRSEMNALSKLCTVAIYQYQQQYAKVHHQQQL